METSSICYNDDELQRLAKEQLHEDPEQTNEYIREIRQWLHENQYTMRTDDIFILAFLRQSKFKPKNAKEKIEKYHCLHLLYPKLYEFKDPSLTDLMAYLEMGIYIPINYNTLTGTKVVILRPGVVDPWNTHFDDTHMLARMVGELCILDKQTQILGVDIVIDCSNFGVSHLSFFTPNVIRMYIKVLNAYPFRIKGFHLLQLPIIAYGILALVNNLLPSKLQKRMHFYGSDLANLYEQVPISSLPVEYGGTAGPLSTFIDQMKMDLATKKNYLKDISFTERLKHENKPNVLVTDPLSQNG